MKDSKMALRALFGLLLLFSSAALAQESPDWPGFFLSLNKVSAPSVGGIVTLQGAAKSSVVMLLKYNGTGGEIVVESSIDGTNFTPAANMLLDDPGTPQMRIYFDRAQHRSPDPNRKPTARDPLVAGQPANFVRARLLSVGGASDITAAFGE